MEDIELISKDRRVMVTGNWENLYQGTCNEVGHVRKEDDKVPESILKDLSQLEEFLKSNPKLISLQLASQDKFSFEYHGALLKLIGENCPELECLSLLLCMEEDDLKKQEVSLPFMVKSHLLEIFLKYVMQNSKYAK